MQKYLASLLLMLLLNGCTARPTSTPNSAPVTVPTATPEAPAPPPSQNGGAQPSPEAPQNPLEEVCQSDYDSPPPAGALAEGLLTLLRGLPLSQVRPELEKLAAEGCAIRFDMVTEGNHTVIVAGTLAETGAILWRNGDAFVAHSVDNLGHSPQIHRVIDRPDGVEVIGSAHFLGTANYGFPFAYRFVGGNWVRLLESEEVYRFSMNLLDDYHILVRGRHEEEGTPLAWGANCCSPTDYQWLWKRDGDQFHIIAERRVPDPISTVNYFLGALRENSEFWLARYGTPQAVAQARGLHLDRPDIQFRSIEPLSELEDAEWTHWSALPPALNGPAPTLTSLTGLLTVGEETAPSVTLTLTREADRWVVSGVDKQ